MAYRPSKSDSRKLFSTYITGYPISSFHILVISLSWIVITTLFLFHLPPEPGIIVLTFGGLIGISSLITYWTKGVKAFKELFSETFKWRIHIGYYAFALFAIPALTVLLAKLTGSFLIPQAEWPSTFQNYLVAAFSNFLIINLWEETGWTGFVQSKLIDRKGLVKGSLLTAPGFVAVHIPLYFSQPTMMEFFMSLAVLFFLAFFFRYLLGMIYIDSKKSVFIVGLLHASFNNSALKHKEMLPASIIATIILTLVYHFLRKPTTTGNIKVLM